MVKIKANLKSPYGSNLDFVVAFCTSIGGGSDIPFHFRYFNGMVVMNSFKDGQWQEEQKLPSDPFVPGEPFQLRFLVLENQYQVFVKNKPICQFAHRLPLQSVKMLEVKGDIVLTSVDAF